MKASGYEYLVEFVHCTHVPGRKLNPAKTAEGPDEPVRVRGMSLVAAKSTAVPFEPYSFVKEREVFRKTLEEPIEKKASGAVGKLAKGVAVDTRVETWQIAFRPGTRLEGFVSQLPCGRNGRRYARRDGVRRAAARQTERFRSAVDLA